MMLQPLLLTTPLASPYANSRVARTADVPTREPGSIAGARETGKVAGGGLEADELELSDEALSRLERASTEPLTPEQEAQVQELQQRDREVRAHEQAHLAAAGPYARGGPTYTTQTGPDGREYAIGGEVQIDSSPVQGDPEATIQKAQIVRAAALAPAEPSSTDLAVAASATKMEQQARAELRSAGSDPTQPSDAASKLGRVAASKRVDGPENGASEIDKSAEDAESESAGNVEDLTLDILV